MLVSSLSENYNNIIKATNNLIKHGPNTSRSIKSLRMLIFKIDKDEQEYILEVINQQFNDFGNIEEEAHTLYNAKKTKLENIFKKNLNFL